MATIGASTISLIDMMRGGGYDGAADVAEVLNRLSPVYRNAMSVECNNGTRHKHKIRTSLPTSTWGRLYQGIPQSKSGFAMVEDTTGFIEARSSVDTRELEIAKNPALIRAQEADGQIEAMTQALETAIFYGDVVTTPEQFKGLAARYNTLAGGSSPSAASAQVIDGGGSSSNNCSIWIVTWSDAATTLLYPNGTTGGITRTDMGVQRVLDGNGNSYYVKEELFRAHCGLALKDWRYNARICNINATNRDGGTVDLYALLRKAFYTLQGVYATALRTQDGKANANASAEGRTVIYMNRATLAALDALGNNGSTYAALRLTQMELEGRMVAAYRGIPIEITDALLDTEAKVS
jgi:hypothetical protein